MDAKTAHGGRADMSGPPPLPPAFAATVVLVPSRAAVSAHCRRCLRKPNPADVAPAKGERGRGPNKVYVAHCPQCGVESDVKWQYALQLGLLYKDRLYLVVAYDKVVEKLLGVTAAEFYKLQGRWTTLEIEGYTSLFALTVSLLLSRTFFFTVTLRDGKDPLVQEMMPAEPDWPSLKDVIADAIKRVSTARLAATNGGTSTAR